MHISEVDIEKARRFPGSSVHMPFIVSSNVDKVDQATRKLIRSHVMKGKKQKRKNRADPAQQTISSRAASIHAQEVRVNLSDIIETYASSIPGRVGFDLSTIEFPDNVEASVYQNIARVSQLATRIIYPLSMAIGMPGDQKQWLQLVGVDAAALHITAFAIEGFIDRVLRRSGNIVNPAATLHLQRGLVLLRERLLKGDDESRTSDSTMGVVLKLAGAAHFDGDHRTSQHHLAGLRKMVDLRGGLHVFKGKQLVVEMFRCDLSIALLNGSSHEFFTQASESLIEYPQALLSDSKMTPEGDSELFQINDGDLTLAWQVMRRFCRLVSLGSQTQRLIRPGIINDTMAAVMYRLLDMKFGTESIDEAVQLGLLAFSHHIFLQWQDVKLPYQHFPSAYKQCVLSDRLSNLVVPQMMLWLLMTGACSIFDVPGEAWLTERLRIYLGRCQVKSWKETQDVLKLFLWIGLLDDEAGKRIYESLYLDGR